MYGFTEYKKFLDENGTFDVYCALVCWEVETTLEYHYSAHTLAEDEFELVCELAIDLYYKTYIQIESIVHTIFYYLFEANQFTFDTIRNDESTVQKFILEKLDELALY